MKFQRLCCLRARLIKVELRAGSGQHYAVIGSSEEGAVDRRWPAWDLISLSLADFSLGWRKVFSNLKRKPFISAIDVYCIGESRLLLFPSYIKLTFASLLIIHLS